jgi:hypothetical protein
MNSTSKKYSLDKGDGEAENAPENVTPMRVDYT